MKLFFPLVQLRKMEIAHSHSLQNFPSISQYFIARILQSDTDFDFSFEQILYLCQTEPQNCGQLLAALQQLLLRAVLAWLQQEEASSTSTRILLEA